MKRGIDNLNEARYNPNDEFYTREEDIEKVLTYIKPYFINKIVYCNCDDYRFSMFYIHLKKRFTELGLKGIITTNYDIGNGAYLCMYNGKEEYVKELDGNGSFNSEECIEILKESDIVFTNPPFSLKVPFQELLLKYNKDFCYVSHINSFIRKFKEHDFLIHKNVKIISTEKFKFNTNEGLKGVPCYWFNSFESILKDTQLKQENTYEINDVEGYRIYNRVQHIDLTYKEPILVPITFAAHKESLSYNFLYHRDDVKVNGKLKYWRYLIQRKN